MATVTTYVDSTFSANVIGDRTDSDGTAVTDLSAEEARFATAMYTEGAMTADAFKVSAQDTPAMTVKVGSGTAKADYYCVAGEVAGQGNYIVRLDVTSQNVTIPAADAAQDRVDQIFLVVLDNSYDVSAKSLPRIAHRKGEIGGGAPGADSTWKASALLATVSVPASLAAVTSAQITDGRTSSSGGGDGTGAGSGAVAAFVGGGFETTNSTSYTSLATAGPSITVTVGPSGVVLLTCQADIDNYDNTDSGGYISIAATGANTAAAGSLVYPGALATFLSGGSGGRIVTASSTKVLSGLTPGSTTFTLKYRSSVSYAPAAFGNRHISALTF